MTTGQDTKFTEQYFSVLLFFTLYKLALTFNSVGKILSVTILLYKVALTFESVGKIPSCHQLKAIERYFTMIVLAMLYKVVLTFQIMDKMLSVVIKMKATEQYFPVVLFIMCLLFCTSWTDLTFEPVD